MSRMSSALSPMSSQFFPIREDETESSAGNERATARAHGWPSTAPGQQDLWDHLRRLEAATCRCFDVLEDRLGVLIIAAFDNSGGLQGKISALEARVEEVASSMWPEVQKQGERISGLARDLQLIGEGHRTLQTQLDQVSCAEQCPQEADSGEHQISMESVFSALDTTLVQMEDALRSSKRAALESEAPLQDPLQQARGLAATSLQVSNLPAPSTLSSGGRPVFRPGVSPPPPPDDGGRSTLPAAAVAAPSVQRLVPVLSRDGGGSIVEPLPAAVAPTKKQQLVRAQPPDEGGGSASLPPPAALPCAGAQQLASLQGPVDTGDRALSPAPAVAAPSAQLLVRVSLPSGGGCSPSSPLVAMADPGAHRLMHTASSSLRTTGCPPCEPPGSQLARVSPSTGEAPPGARPLCAVPGAPHGGGLKLVLQVPSRNSSMSPLESTRATVPNSSSLGSLSSMASVEAALVHRQSSCVAQRWSQQPGACIASAHPDEGFPRMVLV